MLAGNLKNQNVNAPGLAAVADEITITNNEAADVDIATALAEAAKTDSALEWFHKQEQQRKKQIEAAGRKSTRQLQRLRAEIAKLERAAPPFHSSTGILNGRNH